MRDAYDGLRTVRELLGELPHKIRRGDRVFLKPNLTYPRHLPGVTTGPDFIWWVARSLQEIGATVVIGESDGGYGAWSADIAFLGHGLAHMCKEIGVQLLNLSSAQHRMVAFDLGSKSVAVPMPTVFDEVDHFITLPVPKIHAVTVYSGAVKNQWGCIPETMRLRRHPDFYQLIWAVNRHVRARLVLADARFILDRNGPMFGDPIFMNRLIASDDVLAFDDAVSSRLMGLPADEVHYLQCGATFGFAPSTDWNVDDQSTGASYVFRLERTLRNRLVTWAFTRRWAINLLWYSWLGGLAHRVLYAFTGDPVGSERRRVVTMAHHHGLGDGRTDSGQPLDHRSGRSG